LLAPLSELLLLVLELVLFSVVDDEELEDSPDLPLLDVDSLEVEEVPALERP
jgi:hypothetical protein